MEETLKTLINKDENMEVGYIEKVISKNKTTEMKLKMKKGLRSASISLMIAKTKSILSVGTIRRNGLKNCTLSSKKELQKRGCGSSDFKFEETHNLISCRWYDNKNVQLVSNYIDKNPMSECKCCYRNEKKKKRLLIYLAQV